MYHRSIDLPAFAQIMTETDKWKTVTDPNVTDNCQMPAGGSEAAMVKVRAETNKSFIYICIC